MHNESAWEKQLNLSKHVCNSSVAYLTKMVVLIRKNFNKYSSLGFSHGDGILVCSLFTQKIDFR